MILKKILKILLLILVFLYPTHYTLGYSLQGDEGMFVSLVNILCVLFALLFIVYGLINRKERCYNFYWIMGTSIVIAVFVLSILYSPFRSDILVKGLIQIVGILTMSVVGLGISSLLLEDVHFLTNIVSAIKFAALVLAITGILQFFYFNFIATDGLFDFSFLNTIAHAGVWNFGGTIDGIARANAYAREPSYYVMYLNFGLGFALIRLGVLGKEAAHIISQYFSLPVAVIVLVACTLSLSILGLMLLICNYLFLKSFVEISKRAKITIFFVCVSFILIMSCIMAFSPSFILVKSELFRKIASISKVFYFFYNDNLNNANLLIDASVLALGLDIFAAFKTILIYPILGMGIGGTIQAYLAFVPPSALYIVGPSTVEGCCLLFKLVIETGIVGTLLYLLFVWWIFFKANRLLKRMSFDYSDAKVNEYLILFKGIYASSLSLVLYYLIRMGVYHNFEYWFALSLVASMPYMLKQLCWRKS